MNAGVDFGNEKDGRLIACLDSSGSESLTRNINAASNATIMPTASVMCFIVILIFIAFLLLLTLCQFLKPWFLRKIRCF